MTDEDDDSHYNFYLSQHGSTSSLVAGSTISRFNVSSFSLAQFTLATQYYYT